MLEKSIEASLVRDKDFEITSAQTLQDKDNSMDTEISNHALKRKYEDIRREILTRRPSYQMDSSNLALLATGKDPEIIISDSFLNSNRINTSGEEPYVSPEFSAITTPNSLNSEKISESVEKLDGLLPENPESTIPDSVSSEKIGNLLDEPVGSISGHPRTRVSNSLNLEAKSNTVEKEPNILLPEVPKSLEEPDVSLPEDPKIIMSNFLNLEASSDTVEASGISLPTHPRSLEELDVALPEHSKATIVPNEPNILLSEDPKSLEEPDVPLLHWKTTMPNSLSSKQISDIMEEPCEKISNTVEEVIASSDELAQIISNSMASDASHDRVEESETGDKGYQENSIDSEEKEENNSDGMNSRVNELRGISPKPHLNPIDKFSEVHHDSQNSYNSAIDWWDRRPERRHRIIAGTLIKKHFDDGFLSNGMSIPYDGVLREIWTDSQDGKRETLHRVEFRDGDQEDLTYQELLACANLYAEMESSLTSFGKILSYNETTAYYFTADRDTVQGVAKRLGCRVEDLLLFNKSWYKHRFCLTAKRSMDQSTILRIDPSVCDLERIKPLLLKHKGWLCKERDNYLWRSVHDIPLVEVDSDHANEMELIPSEENNFDLSKPPFERTGTTKSDQIFYGKLRLLHKFIQENGNCYITSTTSKRLHDFQYDINKGRTGLTKERVEALKHIGFKVIVGKYNVTKQRVEELKALGFEFQSPLHTLSSEVAPRKKRRRVDNNCKEAPRDIKKRKEQAIQTRSSDLRKPPYVSAGNVRSDAIFYEHLCYLQTFIHEHGHVNVGNKDNSRLRKYLYEINSGIKNMSEERVEALRSVGYTFPASSPFADRNTSSSRLEGQAEEAEGTTDLYKPPYVVTGNARSDEIFYNHLCYLQTFIHEHGHGNVGNKDNSRLKTYLNAINNGTKKNMSEERVEALKSVGYKFPASSPFADRNTSSSDLEGQAEEAEGARDLCKPPYVDTGNVRSDKSFHEHLCNLQSFIHEHGHHQIDRSHKKKVNRLRDFCYRLNKEGRSKLPEKRVEALEAIGFKFQAQTLSSDISFDKNTEKGDQRTEVTHPASCTLDSDVQSTEKYTTTMSDHTSCDNRGLGAIINPNSISMWEAANRPLGNTHQENDLPVSTMQEDNSNSETINRPLRNTQENDLPVSTTQEDNKRSGELLSLRERIAILEHNLDVSRDGNLRPKERVLILMEKAGEPRDGANISTCIEKLERDWNF